MFESLLATIALWIASLNTPYVVHADWKIEKAWEKQEEFYVFQASSSKIVEDCRKNPSHYLELPNVLALSHRVVVGDKVIKGNTSENQKYIKSLFNSYWMSCRKIVGGKRLVWQVKSPSKMVGSIRTYPTLTVGKPWSEFVNQTLFIGSSFSLIVLSIFSLLVFLEKIAFKTVMAIALSGPILFLYTAFENCERYHIRWHYLISHRAGFFCLAIGLALFFYCNMSRGLLDRRIFKVFVWAVLANSIFICLGNTFDTVVMGSLFLHPFIVACVLNINYRFFFHQFNRRRVNKYLQGACMIAFDMMVFNEVFMTLKGANLLLFGLAMCCGYVYLFMSINEDIMQTYRDKAALYKKLNDEQEKLFALQTKESIYQSIVSTSQMVAHDMRRPFTFMMGVLALVKKAQTPEQIKNLFSKYGDAVDQSINSVQDMIKDILSFGVKQNLTLEPLSVSELLYYSGQSIKGWKDIKNIEFSFDMQHVCKINGDSHHLKRVVQNIVSNAVKAMNGSGRVAFATRETGSSGGRSMLILSITNDGPLIPKHLQENMFEPFVSGDARKGRGLGLTICRNIIAEHGGSMSCRSDEAAGTTFFVTVPLVGLPDHFPLAMLAPFTVKAGVQADEDGGSGLNIDDLGQTLEEVERQGRKLRILAIDDERVYLSLIDNYLASHEEVRERIELVVLDDYGPVLDADSIHTFDLVILDVELKKEMNGFELLTRWRDNGYKGKVCMHSNWGGFGSAELARKAQADLYIPKPLSQEQLLHIIADVGDDLLMQRREMAPV